LVVLATSLTLFDASMRSSLAQLFLSLGTQCDDGRRSNGQERWMR
jgi:hypothetical protein